MSQVLLNCLETLFKFAGNTPFIEHSDPVLCCFLKTVSWKSLTKLVFYG